MLGISLERISKFASLCLFLRYRVSSADLVSRNKASDATCRLQDSIDNITIFKLSKVFFRENKIKGNHYYIVSQLTFFLLIYKNLCDNDD